MSEWVPHPVEPGRWHWTGDDPPPVAGTPGHDPVVDPAYPRITAYHPSHNPAWPPGWGAEPTERDRAVLW